MSARSEIIGKRYGKSLFEVLSGINKGGLSHQLSELTSLNSILNPELMRFLGNPSFEHAEKKSVLDSLMEKSNISQEIQRFVGVLLDQKDLSLWPQVLESFEQSLLETQNKVEAKVYVARELSAAQKEEVRQSLCLKTGQDVVMNLEVDESLIAGVKAHVGSVIYDASVSGQLDRLVKEI